MTDLRDDWNLFTLRLTTAPQVCVLSDLDGTLAPFADRPDLVRLPAAVRPLLEGFVRTGWTVAGIVSGRTLADLVDRVSVEGLWYVGNNGLEMRDPDGKETRFYEPRDVEYLNGIRDELAAETGAVPGVLLEHKGPTITLHFRQVPLPRIAEVERGFFRVMERHRQRLMVTHGDRVFETGLRSAHNKGTAVRLIRRELAAGSLVVYFGDDLTDRDVFRELRDVGVSIGVGGSEASPAHYTLPDPPAVWKILQRMLDTLAENGPEPEKKKPSKP